MRFPGLPEHVQQFLVSLIFVLLFPLMPLWVEGVVMGYISATSLILTGSIYLVSVGLVSRSPALMAFCALGGFMYAFAYAAALHPHLGPHLPRPADMTHGSGIVVVFVIHAIERYNRHWAEGLPFWPSTRGEGA